MSLYSFSIGEKVWFTHEAKQEIVPVQIWVSMHTLPFGNEKIEAYCVVDSCIHTISAIEIFPEEEWRNLRHCQLLTLDNNTRKKVAGHMVEPMSAKHDRLIALI